MERSDWIALGSLIVSILAFVFSILSYFNSLTQTTIEEASLVVDEKTMFLNEITEFEKVVVDCFPQDIYPTLLNMTHLIRIEILKNNITKARKLFNKTIDIYEHLSEFNLCIEIAGPMGFLFPTFSYLILLIAMMVSILIFVKRKEISEFLKKTLKS